MNILILAAGTRNKIVQYFKKTLDGDGTVVAADASELAPAIYDADKFYIVPPISEDGYIDRILEICKKAGAKVVGAGIAIEKEYQGGGNELRAEGLRIESMARIASMDAEDGISFC